MNHIYRLVFNRVTGAPQAVSETGRTSGAGRGARCASANPCVATRLSPLAFAIRLGVIGIAGSVTAPSAMATCST
ncbi:MAG: ESPR domain-containing protein, partial [Gammaproteobacteria bacterium]|nr:ESPR domain-containing protein [Gammaproteobacteria bacterium]